MNIKRKGNSANSIDRILAAGVNEFMTNGLSQGKIENIAQDANLSVQLIYHYFGNKEALYHAVLELLAEIEIERVESCRFEGMEPLEALSSYIDLVFVGNRQHGRIVIDQIQHEGRHIQDRNRVRQSTEKHIEQLSMIVERGKRQGYLKETVNGQELFIVILLMAFSVSTFGPMVSKFIDGDFLSSDGVHFWDAYCREFILSSVIKK